MDIEVLPEVEHIRKRSEMYTDTKDFTHVLTEILDNSLDELANNFADTINLNISDDFTFSVTDNGRGIPIQDIILPDGSTEDSIVAIATKLFSSGKFSNNNYKTSIGLHGVGITVVSALSEWIQISVIKENNIHNYVFVDFKLYKKEILTKSDEKWSTCVMFKLCEKYFKNKFVDLEKIKNRLELVSSKYENSKIYINDILIEKQSFENYVKSTLEILNETNLSKLYFTMDNTAVDLFYTYDDVSTKTSPTILGDINLNICMGTYISNITTIFYKIIKEIVIDERLTKPDVLSNLRIYCSVSTPIVEFEGQQKFKMTKDLTFIFNNFYDELKIKLNILSIKERFTNFINLKYESSALRKLASNCGNRLSSSNPINDCLKIPGKTLFLVEGSSAKGLLKQIRDNKTEAIFPLTGKISNTIDKDLDKAIASDKIKYLLEAIGVGSSYRYEKYVFIADSDPDGHHVNLLSSIVIWKYAEDLIKEGRVSIILPPLYGARKKSEFIPIYNIEDTSKYRDNGYHIRRFKGLGEFNPDELEKVIRDNPLEYVLQYPKNDLEKDTIYECIRNTEIKRRMSSDDRFGIHRIFEIIKNNQSKERI